MRIVIVTSSENRSGGTRQAIYQARGLKERGHDITLALPENSSFWDLQPDPWWRPLPNDIFGWRKAMEKILFPTKEPIIVHAFHNKAVKRVAFWGLFWHFKGVTCVAHRGVLYRPKNPLPYLSPAMRLFLVNSQACAKAIGWCTQKNKIQIVPNAVPDDRITPHISAKKIRSDLNIPSDSLVFIYVGNDSKVKGAKELLQAFAAAHIPNVILITIGITPSLWRPLCDHLSISQNVVFVGTVENVSDYLQLADSFIFSSQIDRNKVTSILKNICNHLNLVDFFPSTQDSAPNTLLEAIRMGLPVIATNVGGVSDIVEDNGLLVPSGDEQALVKAMQVMADDPVQRTQFGERSRFLSQKYTVSRRCEILEKIYHSALYRKSD